jgi:hypothetical protein
MGTLIVHRLINDRDREVVERAAGEIDRSAAEFLPTLGPGEAIIIGVDIPVPMAIQVQAPNAKPDSQGPNYQVYWSLPVEISASNKFNSLYGILDIQEFENADYDLPDGESKHGMTCQLRLVDQSLVTVGCGAVFCSVGCNWEVIDIFDFCELITIRRA